MHMIHIQKFRMKNHGQQSINRSRNPRPVYWVSLLFALILISSFQCNFILYVLCLTSNSRNRREMIENWKNKRMWEKWKWKLEFHLLFALCLPQKKLMKKSVIKNFQSEKIRNVTNIWSDMTWKCEDRFSILMVTIINFWCLHLVVWCKKAHQNHVKFT